MKATAILRAYNDKRIFKLIENINPYVHHFNIVININKDKNLESALRSNPLSEKITPLPIRNYGWSKALNAGIKEVPKESDLVLCISNGVEFLESDNFNSLSREASKPENSCSFPTYKDRNEFAWKIPRNTCTFWNKKVFEEIGYFNESLDSGEGMEDYELALRAYIEKGLTPKRMSEQVRVSLWRPEKIKEIAENQRQQILEIDKKHDKKKVLEFHQLLGLN